MNTREIDTRINELEFKLQYQEDVIDSLNTALAHQQQDILLLNEKLQLLAKQLQSYRTTQNIHEAHEVPPHY